MRCTPQTGNAWGPKEAPRANTGLARELRAAAALAREALCETLWPTRCAVCDAPGDVLCARCRKALPYLDALRACPVCGAAFGRNVCCECNCFILGWKGLDRFPLDGCASATMLEASTRRIVLAYKDRGEERLDATMAHMMADVLPPAWVPGAALVPLPARKAAQRERGFDHVAQIADELAEITGLPVAPVLQALPRRDQRELDARERLRNMRGSVRVMPSAQVPARAIVVDDVFTTGATLFAAAEALRTAGTQEVYGLTFTRV